MEESIYDAATAYHEAGHAVVALALGRPVQRVSVLPDRVRLGHCEFKKGKFRPSEDWLEREILIALGGIAAEARFTGDYAWGGAARDLAALFDLELDTEKNQYETQQSAATSAEKKQQEIDEIKNATERRIRETEHQVMAMAVIVPPIPAIVLGVVLLLLRLGRERQYIAPERRVEQKPRKK